MRWQRFRVNTGSAIRNQQTFGISEAFTFAHEEHYQPGDYLYKLSGADDLWLGCWGLIRAFPRPGEAPLTQAEVELALPASDGAPLPDDPPASTNPLAHGEPIPEPWALEIDPAPPLPSTGTRRFHIEAVERRLVYRQAGGPGEADIIDPFGLVYRVIAIAEPGGNLQPVSPTKDSEPLVIRCREGETVEVTLFNNILKPEGEGLAVEPHAPLVPLDNRDRSVSPRVSVHADLVLYDVQDSDGASIGLNPYQTVPPGYQITYSWKTARPERLENGVNEANNGQPLGPVLLQDMADFRHHRHHGLVGALIIEEADAVPKRVLPGKATATEDAPDAWHGARATVTSAKLGGKPFEEMVLLMQDGLRLYWNGDTRQPLPDPPAEEGGPDYEDQGQKGFSYGSEPRGPHFDTRGRPDLPPHEWLRTPNPKPATWPATPLWHVHAGSCVHLHLVGACDKPRNHSFTVHGVGWPEARFPRQGENTAPAQEPCLDSKDPTHERFQVSAESAITAGPCARSGHATLRRPVMPIAADCS
jgi:hypothetical protein